jgi:prepilin-type N-terminal cleavage/methylation domain-containing protein
MSLFNAYYKSCRDRGFSLPEILVVVAILGVLAAIAIPVSMNQQSRASDASIRGDLTNVAAVVEGQLLAWRGAPPDGALNICTSTSGDYPPVNTPQNTCEEGQWRVTRTSNNQFLSPPMEGKLSPGIFVQGRIASDGSYCLDGSSSRSGAKNFYFDSQSSQVQEGTCKSINWTPRGSLVGSTGATTTPGDLPPPPSGVAVEVPEGGSTATVKWNAQAGVTYIVKVSNEPAKTLTASTTGIVSCVFPAESCEGPATGNLMVGTYTAIVRAGNSEGWGAGATQDFKIENAAGGSSSLNRIPPPSQPTVSQSGADINVSWTAPTGLPDGEQIIKYRISWSSDGSEWIGELETGTSRTNFKLLGSSFVSGETYYFRVQAISDSGILGRPSQTSTVLNYVVTKPAPPGLLYAVPGLNKVDLFWNGSSANTYVVERIPVAGIVGNSSCTSETTSNCKVTITGLANGTPYVFTVKTRDPQGVLSDPAQVMGTPTAAVPPSSPLTPTAAAGPSPGQITLTWKPPLTDGGSTILQYQVQWSTTGVDADWTENNSVLLEERNISFDPVNSMYTYVQSGLTASVRYYFRIIGVNAQGFGSASTTQNAVPTTAAPTVTATAYDTNVLLSWGQVTGDAQGYVIYNNGSQIGTTGAGVTSFRHSSLPNNTTYNYTVRARNSEGILGGTSTNRSATPTKIASGGAETIYTGSAGNQGVNGRLYREHRFTGVGTTNLTFHLNKSGVEYLIVGGGGGGGYDQGGGGGAGGFRNGSRTVNAGNYSMVVGGGGGAQGWGGNSSAFGITAGGGERGYNIFTPNRGGNLGSGDVARSGGGSHGDITGGGGGAGAGGNGAWSGSCCRDGGGKAGDGGPGTTIMGVSFGGGGGGGNRTGGITRGFGGSPGGGIGGACSGGGGASANTGGGGGGGSWCGSPRNGGSGGSGIIVVRYALDI